MSYFCFGEIELAPTGVPADEAAWQMVLASHEARLSVSCGPNIVQDLVFEMLGTARANSKSLVIPFLLTGSPLENTSDSIISPFHTDDAMEAVLRGLGQVSSWLERVAHSVRPKQIRLLMTDGFDDNFRQIVPASFDLQATVEPLFRAAEDVPSIEILLPEKLLREGTG